MAVDSETEALAALSSVAGLGPVKIRLLVQSFGSAEAALHADRRSLLAVSGMQERVVEGILTLQSKPALWGEVARAQAAGVQVIAYTDSQYPRQLLDLADHPVVLYVKGDLLPSDTRSIAVVGTRTASLYGRELALRLGRDLAAMGFTVVSGLARGVDTQAHQGALETGRTIAVIGSGLADVYPEENRPLSEQIARKGVLMSEFSMNTPPDRQNFPQRNRIVSAMTLGTVVVEAPAKSGAMITASRAMAQRRRLFACPGRVDMEGFRGNHLLLKGGQAQLVESAADIATAFGDLFATAAPSKPLAHASAPVVLEGEEGKLLTLLDGEELHIDEIALRSRLSPPKLSVLLMGLVLKKRIKEFPGKIFKKY